MTQSYLLGIDQGSSGSRAVLLDSCGHMVGYGYQPVHRLYPEPGWVEQDPVFVAASVRDAVAEALAGAKCQADQVVACGITSQRDTVFAWDRGSGAPIGYAITWQDLRTQALVAEVDGWAMAHERRERLGQFPGPYCSAMHIAWRMRHDSLFRRAALDERLQFSLAAGWVVRALGGDYDHALDYSLMQGMTVFDVRRKCLWEEWLEYLHIPHAALPRAVPTLHDFGTLRIADGCGGMADVPVVAMMSDQQAALFGYDCRRAGQAACTHGTASFVNVVAGTDVPAQGRTKVYLAWEFDGVATYSFEADTTVTGAVIRWMQEQMGWLTTPSELGRLALSVPSSSGVVFVPAFTGLGIPFEDRSARGAIFGMTLDSTPAHIARAFVESLGYQVGDILTTITQETGLSIDRLHVGGGIAMSDAVCQIQADILGIPVVRARNTETSVRAAALLAGLGANVWSDIHALPALTGEEQLFEPQDDCTRRDAGIERWHRAIERVRDWR